MDDREDLIAQIGRNEFECNSSYDYLKDIPIPPCFLWVFNVFLEIYGMSIDAITWKDIQSYCEMRKIQLSQYEIDVIIKIKRWANEEIAKLKEDE